MQVVTFVGHPIIFVKCSDPDQAQQNVEPDLESNYLKDIYIPAFFFRNIGYINFGIKSVCRPSVTFLVNVSPPKLLTIRGSNFKLCS